MSSQWHVIHDTTPLPGERVLRYGQSLFGPHFDIGVVLNTDGFRMADWGVTHWMRLDEVAEEAYENLPGKTPIFTPEEWWYLCEHQERCVCGHLAAFHGGDGCLLSCNCSEISG